MATVQGASPRRARPFSQLWVPLVGGLTGLLHWRTLLQLWRAPIGTQLAAQVAARPEVWRLVHTPFIHARWSAGERLERLVDHCHIVERLGPPFDLLPNQYADIIDLPEIGPNYRLMLDQPRWLFRDGLLALSLWEGGDRLFSLAFLLSTESGGMVAFVGGVQGRRGGNALSQYRAFTKEAEGVRPRDLLIELFRMVCAHLGVSRILCVSNESRHQRAPYFTRREDYYDPVTLDYDAMWGERGAKLRDDGFFDLPVEPRPRSFDTIPVRKRSLYRRRREMLALLNRRLTYALEHPSKININQHEPIWL